jgi:hypothetical protein
MHPLDIHLAADAAARAGCEGNVIPDGDQRILSFADLERWFSNAKRGARLEYHRGYLAMDRGVGSRLGEEAGLELDRVAAALMAMAEAGRVHLVQCRNGPNDYTYVAVRARGGRQPGSGRPVREIAP